MDPESEETLYALADEYSKKALSGLEKYRENKVNELEDLDKKKLLKMAYNIIEKCFGKNILKDIETHTHDFDIVEVYKSKSDIKIVFGYRYYFIPLESHSCYYFSLTLINNSIFLSDFKNPEDFKSTQNRRTPAPFFTPTEETKKVIEFLENLYNWNEDPSIQVSICEKEKFYNVEVLDDYSGEWFKLEKTTFKIFDQKHKNYTQKGAEEHIAEREKWKLIEDQPLR